MSKTRPNPDFLNGVPELVILQLLARRPMHGYELVETIRASSDEVLTFGEGCVYPILHRLEAEGRLSSLREVVNGRSRVVYRVSESGLHALERSVEQWRRIAGAISTVLEGDDHGRPIFA